MNASKNGIYGISHFAGAIAAAGAMLFAAVVPSHAQPSYEYVRICNAYGVGFFYIPGTETCVQARQIGDNQYAIAAAATRTATGVAMAASLANPYLPAGTNYAIANHWAGFDGQNAIGYSGLARLSGNFVFSAGFAVGLDRGSLTPQTERTATAYGVSYNAESWSNVRALGRAGFMYAW